MSDALRASLTRIRDEADAGLRALGSGDPADHDTYLTAPLGPYGERIPAWLVRANAERRAAHPSGFVGPDGPDFDGDPDTTSRQALILASAIVDPRVLERSDLSAEQRAVVQEACHNRAWASVLMSGRDSQTGLIRLPIVWVGPIPPNGVRGGEGVIAVPPNCYGTEAEIETALLRLYEIAYGPLPR